MHAVIIATDGTLDVITKPDSETSLSFLQQAVGGYIEPVDLWDNITMYVNEEGKVYNLLYNPVATVIAHNASAINIFDYIYGDVVLIGFDPESGDTVGLTQNQINFIIRDHSAMVTPFWLI